MKSVAQYCRMPIFIGVTLVVLLAGALFAMPSTAYAASSSGGARVYSLKKGIECTKCDIDGDKRKDRVSFEVPPETGDMTGVDCIYIHVNDRTYTLSVAPQSIANTVEVKLITLKNKKSFMFVRSARYSGSGDGSCIYSFRNGAFKRATDCAIPSNAVGGWKEYSKILKVKGNTITVRCRQVVSYLGATYFDVAYVYKKGKLVRASSKGTMGVFKKSGTPISAKKRIKVFTSTSCKKVKFVIKPGQKVKFTNYYQKGKVARLKVKAGNKTGWIKCPTSYEQSAISENQAFSGIEWRW